MTSGIGWKLLGWVFLIATATGFVIENAWLFCAAVLLGLGWIAATLRQAAVH